MLFIGNIFGILAASNIGYVLAHVFALSAFILLEKGSAQLATADQVGQLLDSR